MVAGNYDLNIDQGAEFVLQLTIQQADETDFDLTNFTPKAQIRKAYAGDVAAEFVCTKLDEQGGILQLALTAAQTALLVDIEYVWDVIIYEGATLPTATQVIRLLGGIANVTPSVTREVPAP